MNRFASYLRRHHIALLALFVALGGTSYAAVALPANSVGVKQIKKSAVNRAKLRANAVDSTRVRDGSLHAQDFAPGQLPQGPAGPAGPTGPTGPAGAIASGSDSNYPATKIDLTGGAKTVLSTTVSPTSTSRIVATASVNVAAKPGDAVSCYLELGSGGNFTRISSGAYFDTAPGQADVAFPVVGAAADRPAGTYTVRVQCDAIGGTSSYAAGDLVVVATG